MKLKAKVAVGAAVGFSALLLCPVALATFPGENGRIAFSRDGDIWMMDPDGSNQEQLTSGPADDLMPKWAPDGSAIAFWRHTADHDRVFIYDLVTGLTRFGQLEKVTAPAWSPDARELALTKDVPIMGDPDFLIRRLAVSPIDGSTTHVLQSAGGPVYEPDWSPLGDRIAYELGDVATWIATVGPDGTDRLVVSPAPRDTEIYSRSASWSPDGERIAFTYNCTDAEPDPCTRRTTDQIYTASSDGSDLTELTSFDALRSDSEPAWSPDGSHIVFTRFDLSDPSTPNATIELMDANGAGVEAVTDGEQPEWQPLVAPRNERRPRIEGLARDGQELVAKPGTWFGTPELSFTYQWRRCNVECVDIPGATEPTNVLTEDDVFHEIRVFVTATNAQGDSLAWSLATDTVGRTAVGTSAADHMVGTSGSDLLRGLGGDDSLGGSSGDDFLYGGGGDDRLRGEFGSDYLVGGPGADRIMGANVPQFSSVGDGRDGVRAGEGADWIYVRGGSRDVVDCGGGHDVVVADSRDEVHGDCEVVKVD